MNKLSTRPVKKNKISTKSIRDTLHARYVIEVNSWSRDKLINTLTDLKMVELQKMYRKN